MAATRSQPPAPVMSGSPSQGVTLPLLNKKVHYQLIPRRYEDTKLMVHQDFTHKKILDFGKRLHQDAVNQSTQDKLEAVQEAEKLTWAKAEIEKQEAITQAINKTHQEHARAVRIIKKEHRKALREEALRVQGEMQIQLNTAVQKEREEGQERLEEAVDDMKLRMLVDCEAKVSQAKREAADEAQTTAKEVEREYQEKFDAAMKQKDVEKEEAIANQKAIGQREKEYAIAHTHSVEQVECARKVADIRHSYETKIDEVREYVATLKEIMDTTQRNLAAEKLLCDNLVKELLETRAEFQTFINRTKPFCPGESDYLIPPVKSVDVSTYLATQEGTN